MGNQFIADKYGIELICEEMYVYDNIPNLAKKTFVIGKITGETVYKFLTVGIDGKPLMSYKNAVKTLPHKQKNIETGDWICFYIDTEGNKQYYTHSILKGTELVHVYTPQAHAARSFTEADAHETAMQLGCIADKNKDVNSNAFEGYGYEIAQM